MNLPPLNSLRAFEAAARHGSFSAAAAELRVSAGAVSRHVKLLESHLDAQMFVRLPQGVRLTALAAQLQPQIAAAFESIEAAMAGLTDDPATIRVVASPAITNRWLIPRLSRFRHRHPDVTVSVGTLRTSHRELAVGGYDVGIATFGSIPEWPDELDAQLLRNEELTPLVAPALNAARPLHSPDDLSRHTLLQVATCLDDWPRWIDANGCSAAVDPSIGPTYETGEMVLKAAAEGLGVALMDRLLAAEELASGVLVDSFPDHAAISNGYYFFCERARADEPLIAEFRTWLRSEMADADRNEIESAS